MRICHAAELYHINCMQASPSAGAIRHLQVLLSPLVQMLMMASAIDMGAKDAPGSSRELCRAHIDSLSHALTCSTLNGQLDKALPPGQVYFLSLRMLRKEDACAYSVSRPQ